MAFQPIVNLRDRTVFAYEALVRGSQGESASKVLGSLSADQIYPFDQACRVQAIKLAAQLQMKSILSINFLPNAVYQPELCIRTTLQAAQTYDFPLDRIMFEITEAEKVDDVAHLVSIVDHYKLRGFRTAIDDFGSGYSGLNLLADFQTDLVKLDMALIRNINASTPRQTIVRGIAAVCTDLNITIIAEGVESEEELAVLSDMGIELYQGYLFARPEYEALPEPIFP